METYPWYVQKGRRLHHCWYEWQGKPDCCCKLCHWSCWHHMSTCINLRISVYCSFDDFLIFFQIQKYFLLLIWFVIFLYNSNQFNSFLSYLHFCYIFKLFDIFPNQKHFICCLYRVWFFFTIPIFNSFLSYLHFCYISKHFE